jgi:hypothetical protein
VHRVGIAPPRATVEIAEGTGLRRAASRTPDRVPIARKIDARARGHRIDEDGGGGGQGGEIDRAAARRRQRRGPQRRPRQVIGRP